MPPKLSVNGTEIFNRRLIIAYREMALKLSRVVGYRTTIISAMPFPSGRFQYSPDGHLQYSIFTDAQTHLATLELDSKSQHDEVATRTAQQFVTRSRKFFSSCTKTRDIERVLLRGESLFWDDLLIGYTFPKNEHVESLRALLELRSALHFRYEGEFQKLGIIVTWTLSEILSVGHRFAIPLQGHPRLDSLLKNSKASHRLSNGASSMYLVEGRRVPYLLYRSSTNESRTRNGVGWELVPEEYHWLREVVIGRSFAIINFNVGEQLFVTSKAAMRWSSNQWSRITHGSIPDCFPPAYSAALVSLILRSVGNLSYRRIGALIILPQDLSGLLQTCSSGLSNRLSGRSFMRLEEESMAMFESVCAIDGGTIVDHEGTVIDAGVLMNLDAPLGEGARSAAAKTASAYGFAIKVSHDGPISFFSGGELVTTMA